MKPMIAITMSREKKTPGYFIQQYCGYLTSVELAGGIPILLPLQDDETALQEFLERTDVNGIVFAGGEDLHPLSYCEDPGVHVHYVDPLRDKTEFTLFRIAQKKKIPMLGICRGLQLLNVAFGGTLYQHLDTDLPESVGHHPMQFEQSSLVHEVRIDSDGLLASVFPEKKTLVNSVHHQGIKKLAPDLLPVAWANDGLIESIQYKNIAEHFILGVQWHPESLSQQYPESLTLFQMLIEQAKK
jgi:putative glutamine amidotransferase